MLRKEVNLIWYMPLLFGWVFVYFKPFAIAKNVAINNLCISHIVYMHIYCQNMSS
jgi:hypothetical protein